MSGRGMKSKYGIQAACCVCFAVLQACCVGRSLFAVLLAAGAAQQEAGLSAALFPALLCGGLLWCIKNWLFGIREEGCLRERTAVVVIVGALAAVCAATELFAELCACAATVGVCRLFFRLERTEQQRRTVQEELILEKLKKEQQRELMKANEEIRRLRHDMKNSYQLLLGLLQQKKTEEAVRFLQQEDRQLSEIPTVVYTDREAVNALLNVKYAACRRCGTAFSVRVATGLAGIADYDMCHLLGNLLDNALEAAAGCGEKDRFVDLKIGGDQKKCLIEIVNSVSGSVLQDGKLPRTTKKDARNHGLGYVNAEAIVDQYNGSIRMEERSGSFEVAVLLFRQNRG